VPSGRTITFSGFTSWCTTPWLCRLCRRVGEGCAEPARLGGIERRARCRAREAFAVHALHRDEGECGHRARADVAGRVRPAERRQQHHLGFEADQVDGGSPAHRRDLDHDGKAGIRALDARRLVDVSHRSRMDSLAEHEVADAKAGLDPLHQIPRRTR
jgi:hypothetical protein